MSLSRRGFLKGVGAAGAVATFGVALNVPVIKAFAEKSSDTPQKSETLFSYCRMCMKDDCATLVTVENGIVLDVSGNPDCESNQGTLCPRGKAAIMNLYNPYRVKAPMKRTNPNKGLNEDPEWVEITWDEALDTVGKKFKEIRDNDPRELVYNVGFGMMDYFVTFFPMFAIAYGTPNMVTSNGPLCAVHYATCLVQASFPVAVADYVYGKYLISIGRTGGPNFGAANSSSRGLMDAIEKGLKYVVVDPRCSVEASKGSWVPIRPGTDLPFVLGLTNVILYELKKYDVDFLKNRTNAPYLIKADGDYLRGSSGKPQIWDLSSNSAKDFNDPGLKDSALEGEYDVDGIIVRPGFVLVKDEMKNYTPEWAEEKTTIPASTIRQIAFDFVENAMIGSTIDINGFTFPYRPSGIAASRGAINHEDGTNLDLVIKLLNELIGAMDVPGGHQGCNKGPVLVPTEDGTVTPVMEALGEHFEYPPSHFDLAEYFPHRHSSIYNLFRTMLDPEKYGLKIKPKGMFIVGGNSVAGLVEPEMVAESISKVPFTASIVYHFDETAQLSDIIMPEHAMLERQSINTNGGDFIAFTKDNIGLSGTMIRQPVKPMYNTRLAHEIVIDILEKVGALPILNMVLNEMTMLGEVTMTSIKPEYQLRPDMKYKMEDIWDRALKSYYGDDYGMDYLDKNGMITKRLPEEQCYNYYYYPGSETRYQFYMHSLKESGDKLFANLKKHNIQVPGWDTKELRKAYQAVPIWRETKIFNEKEEYDLFAFNYKMPTSMFKLGAQDQLPWLVDWSEDYVPYFNVIGINNKTAAAKGLKDGDMVIAESPYGKTKGKLKTSELFHPDSVGIGGDTGRLVKTLGKKASEMVHFNALLGAPLGAHDPVMGAVENTARVKIYKA